MNTIEQNNILIAKFMGWDILENDKYNFEGEIYNTLPDFKSDYNVLMNVVDKIEKKDSVDEFNIKFCSVYKEKTCEILPTYKNTFDRILTTDGTSTILSIYLACVEFIKWYNEQK